jgi:plasmid stabilization system protein ParE
MRVRWTAGARRDLAEIHRFIARDNASAARRWTDRLIRRAERVSSFPAAGRIVPELDRPDVREVFLGSYRIIYRVGDREVVLWTIFEGHRSWPDIPADIEER